MSVIDWLDGGNAEVTGITGRSLDCGVDHPITFTVTVFYFNLSWVETSECESQEKLSNNYRKCLCWFSFLSTV